MKVDAKALFEVVRQVVQDEIRKSLPEMVRQHLTESYMKRLVQEAAGQPQTRRQGPGLSELLQTPKDDEELEEIPQPLSNVDKGIYADGMPGVRNDEAVQKLLSKSNPLSFVYEGVRPIPAEGAPDVGVASIPIEKAGFNFSGMNKLVEGMEKRAALKGDASTNEMKMKELEAKRRALEVKVG